MLTSANIDTIRAHHAIPLRVLVETGTYYGDSTRRALAVFPVVHTIELDRRFHDVATQTLGPLGVHCWLGDSAVLVPRLALEIREPVCWFLDAHWFNTREWGQDVPTLDPSPIPLWDELRALAQRPYPDVVIVDDAGDFGKPYPTGEWAEITSEKIAALFPAPRELAVFDNLAVIYRG